MKKVNGEPQLREIGRGFIVHTEGNLAGRRLTKAYMDQNNRTYIVINGEYQLLTEQHGYLAVD